MFVVLDLYGNNYISYDVPAWIDHEYDWISVGQIQNVEAFEEATEIGPIYEEISSSLVDYGCIICIAYMAVSLYDIEWSSMIWHC
jgi:hypothetical protein